VGCDQISVLINVIGDKSELKVLIGVLVSSWLCVMWYSYEYNKSDEASLVGHMLTRSSD